MDSVTGQAVAVARGTVRLELELEVETVRQVLCTSSGTEEQRTRSQCGDRNKSKFQPF